MVQIQRFTSLHERLNVVTKIAMQLLFSLLMDGRSVSYSGIVSDLSHSHVEILQSLMMLEVPVGSIRSIDMQFYASLEYLDGLLPVEVVITDEGSHTPFEIMKPVLMMTTVTHSVNSLTSSS